MDRSEAAGKGEMTFKPGDRRAQIGFDDTRYSSGVQAAHWVTALLVVLIWIFGLIDDEALSARLRDIRVLFHEIAGETVFALLFLRLVFRLIGPSPAPERTAFGRAVSAVVDAAFYLLLFAVPATGIVALFSDGEALSIFGLFEIASPWPKNRELKHYAGEIHETLANSLIALAGLHAGAGLFHHFARSDNALRRMLPRFLSH